MVFELIWSCESIGNFGSKHDEDWSGPVKHIASRPAHTPAIQSLFNSHCAKSTSSKFDFQSVHLRFTLDLFLLAKTGSSLASKMLSSNLKKQMNSGSQRYQQKSRVDFAKTDSKVLVDVSSRVRFVINDTCKRK